jgi:hypothetical protein
MSRRRAILVALATLFTAGTTSAALACCEWGNPAPLAYQWSGCGGCGGVYATPAIEPTPIAPSPIYVVNQGPDYTGPGIMVPYRVYGPGAGYAYYHHRYPRYAGPVGPYRPYARYPHRPLGVRY